MDEESIRWFISDCATSFLSDFSCSRRFFFHPQSLFSACDEEKTTRQKMRRKVDKFSAKFFTFRGDTCLPNKKSGERGSGSGGDRHGVFDVWTTKESRSYPDDCRRFSCTRAATFTTQISDGKTCLSRAEVQPPEWTREDGSVNKTRDAFSTRRYT